MSDLARLFPQGMPPALAAVGQILWLLQIALVIHVYRTGRPYWWTWILFAAPLVGGLAYVFVELLPDFKSPRGLLYALKPRRWRIAELRQELEESETIENRLALAAELLGGGEADEAHVIAAECLRGPFKDDPHTLAAVARYKLAVKRYDEAYPMLERIDTKADRMLALRVQLMRGDCLRGLNRDAEAESVYESMVGRYIGEAPRVGLALVYERTGRKEQATALWRDIKIKFRKASAAWRRSERSWYKLAKTKLSEQKG